MKKNTLIISILLTIATIAWATERLWINQKIAYRLVCRCL